MMVNILILNWNSASDVEHLLHSIRSSIYNEFRVILIHNATDDIKRMHEIFEGYRQVFEMHLVINEENLGYAGGNNRGFEYLQKNNLNGDLLIVNPDVTISIDSIQAVVDVKQESNAGAVMIKTYDEKGECMYDYIKLNGFNQSYHYSDKDILDTDYVAGSFILLDRQVLNKIEMFDERYFMYWEEVDLSFRIRRSEMRIVSTTRSRIVRRSNPKERNMYAFQYYVRNSFYLYVKFDLYKIDLLVFLMKSFFAALKQMFKGGGVGFLNSYFRGLTAGFKILKSKVSKKNEV